MPGISSTRAAAQCSTAHRVSQAFMVSTRSVWGAVSSSAFVSSSFLAAGVSSVNRYPCITLMIPGRSCMPLAAQRVKNAASDVWAMTRS